MTDPHRSAPAPGTGFVAIVRLRRHEPPDELLEALAAGGVDSVEVTLPTPGSLDAVRRWVSRGGIDVGVGTVRTVAGARAAIEAGAQFLVTPTSVPEVLRTAADAQVPVVCGALTPTEIDAAWQLGATAIKVFPSGPVGGPAYLKAVAEPLDDVPMMPTGGVTVETAREYARMGCVGIGVGGALVAEGLVAEQDWAELTRRAGEFADAWRQGRSERAG